MICYNFIFNAANYYNCREYSSPIFLKVTDFSRNSRFYNDNFVCDVAQLSIYFECNETGIDDTFEV